MERIADFDCSISYTPDKANVMADALSRKSYCNHLQVHKVHDRLQEEFRKLNLHIVPRGYLVPPLEEFCQMNLSVVNQGSLNNRLLNHILWAPSRLCKVMTTMLKELNVTL